MVVLAAFIVVLYLTFLYRLQIIEAACAYREIAWLCRTSSSVTLSRTSVTRTVA